MPKHNSPASNWNCPRPEPMGVDPPVAISGNLDFVVVAMLLTRVISRPGKDLLCLDLGHKVVASERLCCTTRS